MSQLHFPRNGLVVLDGKHHQVVRTDKEGVHLRSFGVDQVTRVFPHPELIEAYFSPDRRLTFVANTAVDMSDGIRANLGRDLVSFSPEDAREALRRLAFVQAFDSAHARGEVCATLPGYAEVGRCVALDLRQARQLAEGESAYAVGDVEMASIDEVPGSTLRRWHSVWRKGGRNVIALVPLHERKGKAGSRLDPEIQDIISRVIREDWMVLERPPLSQVIPLVEGRIGQANLKRRSAQLRMPSDTTIYRWVDANVPEFDRVMHREGKVALENKFREGRIAQPAMRPLQEVEIDHTPIDLRFVHDDGTPRTGDRRRKRNHNAYLTVAICRCTRMIVGYHIDIAPPSWASVMACLRMAVLPKAVDDLPPGARWPVFGVPEVVIVDNGREFHSFSLEAAAAHLRFEIRWMPRRKPRMKGTVERWLGTVATDFLASLPGRKFRNTVEKGDYDSEKRSAITLDRFAELFKLWVVDVYHNRPHNGLLRLTPLDKLHELSGFGFRVPPNADDLDPLIALVVMRTVQTDGVTFLGLNYQSKEIAQLRRRGVHLGREFSVKIDPGDISTMLVLDDANKRWVEAPCITPGFIEGTTLGQWREAVEAAKLKTERGQRIVRPRLIKALMRIREEAKRCGVTARRDIKVDHDWFRENANLSVFEMEPDQVDDAQQAPTEDGPPPDLGEASTASKRREVPGRETGGAATEAVAPPPPSPAPEPIVVPIRPTRRAIPRNVPDLSDPTDWSA